MINTHAVSTHAVRMYYATWNILNMPIVLPGKATISHGFDRLVTV